MNDIAEALKELDQRERMILMMTLVEQELEVMLLEDWETIVMELRSRLMLYHALPVDSIPLKELEEIVNRFEATRKIKKQFDSKESIMRMAEDNLKAAGLL